MDSGGDSRGYVRYNVRGSGPLPLIVAPVTRPVFRLQWATCPAIPQPSSSYTADIYLFRRIRATFLPDFVCHRHFPTMCHYHNRLLIHWSQFLTGLFLPGTIPVRVRIMCICRPSISVGIRDRIRAVENRILLTSHPSTLPSSLHSRVDSPPNVVWEIFHVADKRTICVVKRWRAKIVDTRKYFEKCMGACTRDRQSVRFCGQHSPTVQNF